MTSDTSRTFEQIYANDKWTNGSGPGSFPQLNLVLLDFIAQFIAANNICRLVDVGCGDFQLWRNFNFSRCSYTGFDVVRSVIERNRHRFGSENIQFHEMPQNVSELPKADLYIIKDVLIHLSTTEARQLASSACDRSRFALFVNNTIAGGGVYNSEIATGQFRPVDVSRPPFELSVVQSRVYGEVSALDPRWPRLVARVLRRRVWPGEKHIQLVAGRLK